MFNDSVSFNGGTRVEVIAVLANCGRDTDRARRALVTWIRHKQDKGRSTEHILAKLRDIESKFIKFNSLHSAFRDARAETFLPRAPDLPLPPSLKRNSTVETVASLSSSGPSSLSSPSAELPIDSSHSTQRTSLSMSASPLRLSPDVSPMPIFFAGKPRATRRMSLPRGVPHAPPSRIQIPRNQATHPTPNSPITSSPEDSGIHFRYRHMSQPVRSSSRSSDKLSPPSASPPTFPPSSISSRDQNPDRRLSHHISSPSPQIQIQRSQSQRSYPNSSRTSFSDESDFRRSGYRHTAQSTGPASPIFRRVTPPRTSPPDVPLPPIPSDDQDADSISITLETSMPAEQPLTPLPCATFDPSTPIRPLPIQPIPSPVPGSDDSEHTDTMGGNSLRQRWQGSTGELLPSDDVVREDSPLYGLHDDHDHASQTGIGPPPPYIDHVDTYSPPDMPTIGDVLDRAVDVCGGSREVRLEVSRCIGFHSGSEPPYWQTRLQACGLNAEAAKYLVDEMSKQVDWSASFGRAV